MDKYSFLQLVSSIGIFMAVLLSLFLITVKTKHKPSNYLLAFFFLQTQQMLLNF